IVRERARQYPMAIAVGGQQGLGWKTLTSQQLLDVVDRLAMELATNCSIASGDRVVLWIPNSWQAPVYLFALWKLGGIVVPFDREMNPGAAVSIIGSVEPRCIIAGYSERPGWALDQENFVEWWEPGLSPPPALLSAIEERKEREPTPSGAKGDEGSPDLAAIFFTSGTTGQPKGCMISHANLCFEVGALSQCIPLDPSCRLASILPLSHLFELTCGLLYPLSTGAAIHYIPSRRGPDIVRVLREQQITHMIAVPQLLTMMGQALDEQLRARLPGSVYRALNALTERLPIQYRRHLFFMVHRKLGGHLQLIASGGAALPPEVHRQWERIGVGIVQGYGTSECSPVVAAGVPGGTPIGSVGKPLPGVEVRLSTEGELLTRGPHVMRGYWQDPVRTAEVLQDGWYATGDQARIDSEGNIWILGRLKELIVLPSGVNVWPQDVEDVLRSHPAVKDAAIVPVPTPSGGAMLHAYLIPRTSGDQSADLATIAAWANGRLAQHQRIVTASWWASETGDFPRTSTLKVRRHLLPLPDRTGIVKVESTLAADDPVGQAISAAAHASQLADHQTLGELGLDSLGLVELALQLEEKTGKVVDDGDLTLDMTVAQVRATLVHISEEATNVGRERSRPGEDWEMPLWPYTWWGRSFRALSLPFDLLYRASVTRTFILGGEHLADLPPRVIFAGTHRSYADLVLLQTALSQTAARGFARRLVVAAGSARYGQAGLLGKYATLAYGLYPLQQYHGRAASLRGLAQLAALGNAVLIFPQGKHTPASLEQAGDPSARFRSGVAQLASALDAVVVPFGLAGTDRLVPPAPPKGFKGPVIAGIPVTINCGPLAIAFGMPLRREVGEEPRAFTERLEQICFTLARQAEEALVSGSLERST
ncbi:MAG TPA: AMP-binding protein, partial [Chloroflexota bacterium]|nr:AMP-binding protein [Chloroflexota bacterium]